MSLRAVRLCRRWEAREDEAGFTMVEAVVALVVAALIFTAVAAGMVQAVRATLFARQNQQSVDVVTQQVETLRGVDYASLSLSSSDATFATDPSMKQVSGAWFADVDGKGSYEKVVTLASGASVPIHTSTVVRNNTRFSMKTYVTTPPTDSAANTDSYRRLTVVASWTVTGTTHTRRTSTFVTTTRRGLPLPNYTWTQSGITNPVSYAQGSTQPLVLEGDLTNRGARDRWSLSATTKSPAGVTLPWTWVWYLDDGNGTFGPEDTRADTNADGTFDTGTINTDDTRRVWAVTFLSPSETLTSSCTSAAPTSCDAVSLSAVSTSMPSDTADQKPPIVNQIKVSAPTCVPVTPACLYKNLYLHNLGGTLADGPATASTTSNPMSAQAPVATTLVNYDNDLDTRPGRGLAPGGSGYSEASTSKSVIWTYSTANAATFSGQAVLDLSAVLANQDPTAAGAISAYVRLETTAGNWVNAGSGTFTSNPWNSGSFREFTMPIALTTTNVCKGCRVELRIEVPSSAATSMDIAYDTTTYDSLFSLPYTTTSVTP
jgi:Tfp pilus assembly protein PilV